MNKTRLASKEIFSPSKKIQREVGRSEDLSAPLFSITNVPLSLTVSNPVTKTNLIKLYIKATAVSFEILTKSINILFGQNSTICNC
jgi:hypothetical protein